MLPKIKTLKILINYGPPLKNYLTRIRKTSPPTLLEKMKKKSHYSFPSYTVLLFLLLFLLFYNSDATQGLQREYIITYTLTVLLIINLIIIMYIYIYIIHVCLLCYNNVHMYGFFSESLMSSKKK